MGGWKLEATRFLILVGFPVASFWAFNQTGVFDFFMKDYQIQQPLQDTKLKFKAWKEEIAEERRKREYEIFLREQMAFEESRQLREQKNV